MTHTAINDAEHRHGLGQSLWDLVAGAFWNGMQTPKPADKIEPQTGTDHMSELLENIEFGYTVQETGEHVVLPRYARTHVKTLIKTGGWA
ncbi:MAG: hypothetical protein GKR97_20000 [Rhizobiaceae bacterium]|nr:hypothetical protein [Rhizobiaceae bacterium]